MTLSAERKAKNFKISRLPGFARYALCPMRSDLALRTRFATLNQSINNPRIALSDEGLELGFHLPGGERGAAAGTQAGSP